MDSTLSENFMCPDRFSLFCHSLILIDDEYTCLQRREGYTVHML